MRHSLKINFRFSGALIKLIPILIKTSQALTNLLFLSIKCKEIKLASNRTQQRNS